MKSKKKITANMRMRVLDRSINLDLCELFDAQNFEQVKSNLDGLEARINYGVGEDVKFRVSYSYDYTDIYLDVYRDETPTEYSHRLNKEEKAKEKARLAREKRKEAARKLLMESEAAERAEYERLRAKFG